MRHNIISTLFSATLAMPMFSHAEISESCRAEKADLALLNQQSQLVSEQIKKLENDKSGKTDSEILSALLLARQSKETPGISLRLGSERKVVNVDSGSAKSAQIAVYNEFLRKIKLDIDRKERQISNDECAVELKDCQAGTKITDENICEVASDADSVKINESASSLKDFNDMVTQDIEKLKKVIITKNNIGSSKTKVRVRASVINLITLLPLAKSEALSGLKETGFASIAEAAEHIGSGSPDLTVDLSDMQLNQLMENLEWYKNSSQFKADLIRKGSVSEEMSRQKFKVK